MSAGVILSYVITFVIIIVIIIAIRNSKKDDISRQAALAACSFFRYSA